MKKIPTLLTLVLAFVSMQAFGEQANFADILNGKLFPAEMKPEELTDEFHAVELKAEGNIMQDLMNSSMGAMGSLMGGLMGGLGGQPAPKPDESARMAWVSAASTAWTKGQTVELFHSKYLVIYQMRVDLMSMMSMGPNAAPSSVLKLQLVREDSIKAITPKPELTKEKLLEIVKAMSELKPSAGLFSELGAVGQDAEKEKTIANARSIAKALILYGNDYDASLPYVQSTSAMQYAVNDYMTVRDSFLSTNPSGTALLFNMKLAGALYTEIKDPKNTPVVYENGTWEDGSRVVAFADGHARSVTAEEWPTIEAALQQTFKRHGKPLPMDYGKDFHPSQ